jgi:hypothetical protein
MHGREKGRSDVGPAGDEPRGLPLAPGGDAMTRSLELDELRVGMSGVVVDPAAPDLDLGYLAVARMTAHESPGQPLTVRSG